MKLTNSQEEYLKTIYILEKNKQKVRVTDIADKLKITKPSVNKAINLLKDNGVINYQAYGEITLTKEGEKYAIEIIKKQERDSNKLHCPTCSSVKVKKISGTAKVAGAAMFGLFSKTARSQFECEKCGYKW